MSNRKSPFKKNHPFDSVWLRIQSVTPLKKQNELSKIVGTSNSNISKRSKENIFPPDWAFRIAQKYNLSTDWIMTGEGEKNLKSSNINIKNQFINEIETWLSELIQKEPFREEWFKGNFLDAFPKFEIWRRAQGINSNNNTHNSSKAA
jgi:hypothetical protein